MTKIPEKAVVKSVLDYYAKFPAKIKLWRNNTGSMKTPAGQWISFGLKGSPDIIGYLAPKGVFVGIECKGTDGKASDAQEAFLEGLRGGGGIGIIAHDLKDVQEVLGW